MNTINKQLSELNACLDAKEWAKYLTWEQIYNTCHRGDWLLWLFKKTNQEDLRSITLAKAHCANTVRGLMKDSRSINAIDVAIKFGNNDATIVELTAAADAAYAAAADADYAAYAAAYAAAAAADAAAAAAADAAATAYDANARKTNQLLTANICRQYLPIDKFNIVFD